MSSDQPKNGLPLLEVIQALRKTLHPTNEFKPPENQATFESIDLELTVVIQPDPVTQFRFSVAEPDVEYKHTHVVRVKLKPSRRLT